MPYGADPTVGATGYGRDPEQAAAAKPKPQPKEDGGSTMGALFHSFLHGAESTVGGAMQFAERAVPSAPSWLGGAGQDRMRAAAEQAAQRGEQQYRASPETRAHPIASDIGRIAGEIAPTLAIPGGGAARLAAGVARGLPSAAGMIGRGAALGAAGGAAQPVAPPQGQPAGQAMPSADYWGRKWKDLAVGAGLGAALPAAGSAIAPRLPQVFDGGTRIAQGVARAFRPMGDFATGVEERTVNGFDRTIARQVLDPIKGQVPRNLTGHDLLDHTGGAIGDVYNRVLPQTHLPLAAAQTPSANLTKTIRELAPEDRNRLNDIIQTRLWDRFPGQGAVPNAVLSGTEWQAARHDLGERARRFLGTNNDDLGQALLDGIAHLDAALVKPTPQIAEELGNANNAWRLFVRMQQAAGTKADGRFTPNDLWSAVRGQERGDRALATGDAPLQGYAQAGMRALNRSTSPADLLHVFSKFGLPMEVARNLGPLGRGAKAASPGVAAPLGREQEKVPGIARAKAAMRVSEIQRERYLANRNGDTPKVAELGQKLAEAQADYKKLVPQVA
jgi:hypothetical protein